MLRFWEYFHLNVNEYAKYQQHDVKIIERQQRIAKENVEMFMLVSGWVLLLQIDAWAQSNSIPGQFTGSTGAQILSSDELTNSGPQAWIRKVEVTQTLLSQHHTSQSSQGLQNAKQVPYPVAEHVPGAAGWAQSLSVLGRSPRCHRGCDSAQRGVPGEAQPATDRTWLVLLCWQWQILHCLTGTATHQARFDPAAVEVSGFWHRSQTALVFALVLSGCSFASLWITRVFWEPETWRIKAGGAVNKSLSP